MSTSVRDQIEKERDEVRELQEANQRKRLENLPNEYEDTADATSASGDEKEIEITAFGGQVYINTHGVAKLDRDGLIALRKRLDRAQQVL